MASTRGTDRAADGAGDDVEPGQAGVGGDELAGCRRRGPGRGPGGPRPMPWRRSAGRGRRSRSRGRAACANPAAPRRAANRKTAMRSSGAVPKSVDGRPDQRRQQRERRHVDDQVEAAPAGARPGAEAEEQRARPATRRPARRLRRRSTGPRRSGSARGSRRRDGMCRRSVSKITPQCCPNSQAASSFARPGFGFFVSTDVR